MFTTSRPSVGSPSFDANPGVPFGENAEDPMEVYMAIINEDIKFPKFTKDREFKNLMLKMLEKTLMRRLYKLAQVKNHKWFSDFNWVFYIINSFLF